MKVLPAVFPYAYESVIYKICDLNWSALSADELAEAALAYYYFSIQFRENLEIACRLFVEDENLRMLDQGERDTDNLSPWPAIAAPGERMDHDEFMRRLLLLSPMTAARRAAIAAIGSRYLDEIRDMAPMVRAFSIASYEDGGLTKVFQAFLTARHWRGPGLRAFRHFLTEHIRFDNDPQAGHGALSRGLVPDDSVLPLWSAFHDMLVEAVPRLATPAIAGVAVLRLARGVDRHPDQIRK